MKNILNNKTLNSKLRTQNTELKNILLSLAFVDLVSNKFDYSNINAKYVFVLKIPC